MMYAKLKLFIKNLKSAESLRAKVSRGGLWLGVGNGFEQILRLVRTMILTRILAPEVFGLMAIVLAVNSAFESFTQVGVKEAVIQNPKGHKRTYLNGAWWLAFARAILLYAIVFVGAPWISDFYENKELVPLLRVAFLSLLLNGIMSSEAYVALKKMKFRKWAAIFHGGGVAGILITILLAFIMENVWALVIGFTAEAVFRCVLSYMICPFMPGLVFERDSLNALLKYARGMFGLPILTFIFMRADIFVIGKICTMSELGLYSIAVTTAWLPFNFITTLIGQVAMPAFSEKQVDKEWINKWVLKITSFILYFGIPVFLFLIFCGGDVLSLVYGGKYGAVAVPFAIIFATAIMRTGSVPIAAVYFATGKPQLQRLFTGIRAALIVALIFPAVKWFGLTGAASAGTIAMFVGYIFQVRRMNEITGLELSSYFRVFLRAMLFSLPVIVVWAMNVILLPSLPIVNILTCAVGCIISYGMVAVPLIRSKRTSEV